VAPNAKDSGSRALEVLISDQKDLSKKVDTVLFSIRAGLYNELDLTLVKLDVFTAGAEANKLANHSVGKAKGKNMLPQTRA
jgi:hypothetical protein